MNSESIAEQGQAGTVLRVWVFDINRRIYRRDEHGKAHGGPIWREHWREEKVVGETSRSWITERGTKVPKKGANSRLFAFSEEEIDRESYVQESRHKIADMVRRLTDHDTLKRVAECIGYQQPDAKLSERSAAGAESARTPG